MASKISRKGKNPGPVDSWLDTLGYYRKNVAFDETCLFRAVAEQILACQLFHEEIRKACIEYARENYHEFTHLVPHKQQWSEHLDKLSKHMAVCGDIEINIISRKYKRDVLLFDSLNRQVQKATVNGYPDQLLLCLMGEDHYDVVYKREYIAAAGFCQSIIYNVLYEKVFDIPHVSDIVQGMLYEKSPLASAQSELGETNQELNEVDTDFEECLRLQKDDVAEGTKENDIKELHPMYNSNLAPFPFKVAKALDPTIYRNIEYDTWTEIRKEMRLGEWYYGDENLIHGTRCILKCEHSTLQCYIQKILKESNECMVYITSLAEMRTVNYNDLSPEDDAKPWPLPYRFSKNLLLYTTPELTDKERKNSRKRKDKKRSTSKSSSDSSPTNSLVVEINNDSTVNAYEGCPLQMQTPESYESETSPSAETVQSPSFPQQQEAMFQWENWAVPTTPEAIMWAQTSTTTQNMFTFAPKAVVPTTPEAAYPDQVFYYPVPENFSPYNMWTNAEYASEQPMTMSPQITEVPPSPDPYNNYMYFNDNTYSPAANVATTIPDKIYQLPVTPASPQVEIYHPPIYNQPLPGSPVIYGNHEMSEVVMPQSPHVPVFSPQMELSYISPGPYMYPPTPPATWFPPGINSQGFIFPAQNVANRR